jgi:mRNA interferase YafQ
VFSIVRTNKFKQDYKLSLKRGFKEVNLVKVLTILTETGKLPSNYKPHKLKGKYTGLWECHIQPDWLLIWEQNEVIKLITLMRTGTHSDLF